MAVTLMEAAQLNGAPPIEAGIVKMFAQKSPIFELLPFDKISSDTYTYRRETSLPGIGWRAVNQAWSESTGVINPLTERLMILGGEVKIDRFLLQTQPDGSPSLKRTHFALKVQAMSNEFDRAFFEGDDLVDPNQLVGLRRRLTGSQVMLAGAGGATLTLAMLDQLLDLVPFENKVLFMNRTLRRKVTALANASGGSVLISYDANTNLGTQFMRYGGTRIAILETLGDASTIVDFDEDPGDGTSDTASIYCVAFGDNLVKGIYNHPGGKVVDVQDFGELESEPRVMGRIEGYYGMVIQHPRAAARLRGVTNT